MTSNHAIGTDHDTGPATDAFIAVGDHGVLLGPADGAADTGVDAGGVFAVTAEDGDFAVAGESFHVDPRSGPGCLTM